MEPYKPLIVIRWITETDKIKYLFDSKSNKKNDMVLIKENIYQDDNLEYAINKIIQYIKATDKNITDKAYVWKGNKSILFNIKEIKWKGYNVNPFKSINRDSKELEKKIEYDYNTGLFEYSQINIVFSNDFDFSKNKYYYTNTYVPNDLKSIKNREALLYKLINKEVEHTNIESELYNSVDLYDKIKPTELAYLFDRMTTNNNIQIIQWINDNNNVLYKLYKNHRLDEKFLKKIFDLEKNVTINCINIYSFTSNVICKITIDSNGNILISYILSIRNNVKWDHISNNKKIIIKYLTSNLRQAIKPSEIYLNLKVYIVANNNSFRELSKKIGEYIDIFHVNKLNIEKNKNIINCTYKRSTNYNKDSINISEYIKSRLNLGITVNDLINELVNYDIDNKEAENLILEVRNIMNNPNLQKENKNINIKNTGTIVNIEQHLEGYNIEIINCPSRKELNSLLYWLTRIIENNRKKTIKVPKDLQQKDLQQKAPQQQAPQQKDPQQQAPQQQDPQQQDPQQQALSPSSSSESDKEYDLSKWNFSGGALTKNQHGYLINLLRNADNNLFIGDYARQCQASHQPLVLNKTEKEALDKKGLLKHFDNIIEYGSSKSNENFYTCPRLWCPISKIPLNHDSTNPSDLKCPIENEEPMEMYWDNDKTKPRFVKLKKNNKNNELLIPCCFKRDDIPKEDKSNIHVPKGTKSVIGEKISIPLIQKDKNYLLNTTPIPINRYGVVPESLYKILYPNVNFVLCSNLNKTDKCLVKKGIRHKSNKENANNDSIIHALAYLLNFENKNKFVNDISKRLDIIKFMTLENGALCKSFIDETPIIAENEPKLLESFNKYINSNAEIKKLLHLNNKKYELSRILNIYKAYNKFIDFLRADNYPNEKNPNYLYSLLSVLYNVMLVIWEKNEDDINIVCPYYNSFQDIISGLGLNPKAIMLLKDGYYYEPLELKLRSIDGEKLIKINDYPNIKSIINECNKLNKNYEDTVYNNLETYNKLTKSNLYSNGDKFKINRVLINSDLSIDRFLTEGNILIKTKPITISLLNAIIKNMKIKKILFYDDIVNDKYKIEILLNDFKIFIDKVNKYDIGYNLGELNSPEDAVVLVSTLTIFKKDITSNNIIHTGKKDALNTYIRDEIKESKKWYQLQLMVGKTLLKKLDDEKINVLNNKKRIDAITTLLKNFDNIPKRDIKMVQIILEEMPLYSMKHIEEWIKKVMIYNKYDFDHTIKEKKDEFIFTGNTVFNEIPSKLLMYHKNNPNNMTSIKSPKISNFTIKKAQIEAIELPSMYNYPGEKLKSKWIKHKKKIWENMRLLRNNEYNKNVIPELFEWLVKMLNYNLTYQDVIDGSRSKYFDIINNKDAMENIFSDPSFMKEYVSVGKVEKKAYTTLRIFLDNYYKNTPEKDKAEIINTILSDNKIYPNDINLLTITELLNVSILLIHRAKYGIVEKKVARGDIEDLIISSTFMPAQNNIYERPLIILGKENDKKFTSYHAITEANKNIYIQLEDAPEDIKILIRAHITQLM
jgi:hypothetical protein